MQRKKKVGKYALEPQKSSAAQILMELPENAAELIGREFVHFKGGHYRLHGFATNTETRETMVVYEALYGDGGLWVRPAKMFFEQVEKPGYSGPRFKLLKPLE